MRYWKRAVLSAGVVLCIVATGCASQSRTVERLEDEQVDLSGRWNDSDARMVSEEMVSDVLNRPWLTNFVQETDEQPVVLVGDVRNRSSEHVDTSIFINSIERELINSGEVRFVAGDDIRDEIREERDDQQMQATQESVSRLGAEQGADFMLVGQITSTTDAVEGERVVAYQVNLDLINIETNEIVWVGEKEIRKLIEQDRLRL